MLILRHFLRLSTALALLVGCAHSLLSAQAASMPRISSEAEAYLARALDIMQMRSVRREHVDWAALRAEAFARAGSAQTPAETYDALRHALTLLRDRHSFLMEPQQVARFSTRGAAENPSPSVQRVSGVLGQVLLPHYSGGNPEGIARYVAGLHRAIAHVDSPAVCGWLVDLRENGGGNMWPMLAGIGPILGEGTVGMFVHPGGQRLGWSYYRGEARSGQAILASAEDSVYAPSRDDRPVAVLMGPKTASSGEAIVVAFLGRPNTRSFGHATRGLSTANSSIPLSDGAWMMLTTAVFADRTGKLYGDVIEPDHPVEADQEPKERTADPVVEAATAWLLEQPACKRSP